MAFDQDGTLYGLESNGLDDYLLIINPQTLTTEYQFKLPGPANYNMSDLAVSPISGRLFASRSLGYALFELSVPTGPVEMIGADSDASFVYGLAYDYDGGRLYASESSGRILEMSTLDGSVVEVVATHTTAVNALVFVGVKLEYETDPPNGFIDAGSEVGGVDEITFMFNRPVFSIDGSPLDATDFGIVSTDNDAIDVEPRLPAVFFVDTSRDGTDIRVVLDTPIPVGEWILLTADVVDSEGNEITVSVRLGHLPCDVNRDGVVDIRDATTFGEEFGGEQPEMIDLNRSGTVNISDASEFGNLWHGRHNASRPWNGMRLPTELGAGSGGQQRLAVSMAQAPLNVRALEIAESESASRSIANANRVLTLSQAGAAQGN